MAKSFEAFMEAKKNGYLRSMKVSGYGAASVDSDQLIKSKKVEDNIKKLRSAVSQKEQLKI